jgi:prephenate dehydratase
LPRRRVENLTLEQAISQKEETLANSVAFQGELGAYSQSAVYTYFGKEKIKQVVPLPTFSQVFASLFSTHACDYAVIPIENSLAGSIGETLDLLHSSDVKIVGEVSIPIEHGLLARKGVPLNQIRKVISHPQAIAQCKRYLDSKDWQQIPVYDTAGAAKMVRDENLKDTAAIASRLAAEIYGLEILERNIEDDSLNSTRFVVIESNAKSQESRNLGSTGSVIQSSIRYKTSVIFATEHKPGALVGALSALSTRNINLTKIESRPIKSRPWEYYFFIDFEGHKDDQNCREALQELKRKTSEIKILGSYKLSSGM